MTDRNIRRWALLGALVSTALLTPACDRKIPKEGSSYEGNVNEAQKVETTGTGGSGLPRAGQQQAIGAPGYSSPAESPLISPLPAEPQPQLRESGGNRKADQRLKMPSGERSNTKQ
ncbi:MAG: hypothetical protein ACJ8AT_26310 [Hyalangium sp.]|uniref:hypothetical protein n=1 Tax=Hyalangium sp. TaxID=2028555 RepID=UPI00389A6D66